MCVYAYVHIYAYTYIYTHTYICCCIATKLSVLLSSTCYTFDEAIRSLHCESGCCYWVLKLEQYLPLSSFLHLLVCFCTTQYPIVSPFPQSTSDVLRHMKRKKFSQYNGPSNKMERIIISKQMRHFVAHRAPYTILFSYYFTLKNNKQEENFKTGLLFQNVFFERFQKQSFQAPFSSNLIPKFQDK